MRVLYVSKALVVAAYRDKIREMQGLADVTAVIPERWGAEAVEASPAGLPEPHRVPVALPGHNHLHVYPGATRWLDEARPDLVHIDEEPYSAVTWQLARLCRRRGVPCLFFAWQNLPRRLPPPFGALRRRVFRWVRGGLAGTDAAALRLREAGYGGALEVVPQFGVDPERFRPDPEAAERLRASRGLPAGAFVVGYAGRLVPEKGVGVLLDAVAGLAPRPDRPTRTLVAGDGPDRTTLEGQALTLGIGGDVVFAGRIPSVGVPATLAGLDVLVLPSVGTRTWSEQFGRVLVEAMACGVPVVGSRCGEIPEVVGDAGEIVPAGDVPALRAVLRRLRDDPDRRAELARRGRQRVLERFTQSRIAERTVAFYRALLGSEDDAAPKPTARERRA